MQVCGDDCAFYFAFSEIHLLCDKCIISLRLKVSLSTAWNQVSNQRQLINWQSLISNEINIEMLSHGMIFMFVYMIQTSYIIE